MSFERSELDRNYALSDCNWIHVNRYLMVQKFKYEDLRVAMLMFKPG